MAEQFSKRLLIPALGAVVLVLVVLPPVLPTYVVILLSQTMVYAMVAMSLDVLIGYTNLGSLGHATYFAIGAFATAILETKYKAGFAVSFFSSIGIAAGASALIGSLVVGLIDNFGKALFPELSYFTLFLPMAFILAFKPEGLYGRQ